MNTLQKYKLFFYSPTILAQKYKKCVGWEVEYKENICFKGK